MMAALSVTYLLSILLQNLLCCIPIVAVLLRKSGCLAMQNNRFYDTKPPLLFFRLPIARIQHHKHQQAQPQQHRRQHQRLIMVCRAHFA